MAVKVIGGDYKGYLIEDSFGQMKLFKVWGEKIPLNKETIEKIEVLTEESKKKFLGAAGLGVVGGLLLGPLGMLAGLLAGGNKKEVCFACYLKNGKKFMAVSDPKTYQKLSATIF